MSGRLDLLPAALPAGATGWFTTRSGGGSSGDWAGLDLALHVGDERAAVLANRRLLEQRLAAGAVSYADQVHGTRVAVVTGPPTGETVGEADALVTAERGRPLAVLVADCLPVLLADPDAGVVAAAHAGRRGLAAGVLTTTLQAMAELGARIDAVTAVIGPGVCGRCYQVPAQLRDEVAAVLPAAAVSAGGSAALDLPAGAEAALRSAGVAEVRRTGLCTVEDPRFYSYRRDGRTGRTAGVVWLDR